MRRLEIPDGAAGINRVDNPTKANVVNPVIFLPCCDVGSSLARSVTAPDLRRALAKKVTAPLALISRSVFIGTGYAAMDANRYGGGIARLSAAAVAAGRLS